MSITALPHPEADQLQAGQRTRGEGQLRVGSGALLCDLADHAVDEGGNLIGGWLRRVERRSQAGDALFNRLERVRRPHFDKLPDAGPVRAERSEGLLRAGDVPVLGFIKLISDRRGVLIGATIVASRAVEMSDS